MRDIYFILYDIESKFDLSLDEDRIWNFYVFWCIILLSLFPMQILARIRTYIYTYITFIHISLYFYYIVIHNLQLHDKFQKEWFHSVELPRLLNDKYKKVSTARDTLKTFVCSQHCRLPSPLSASISSLTCFPKIFSKQKSHRSKLNLFSQAPPWNILPQQLPKKDTDSVFFASACPVWQRFSLQF